MTVRGRPASLPEAGFAGGEASIRCHSLQPLLACSADGAAVDDAGADGADGAGADGAAAHTLRR